jgi:hypothetical protein
MPSVPPPARALRRLRRLAVEAAGRRAADPAVAPTVEEFADARALVSDELLVLDHAGPAAARWSTERPVGVAAVPEVRTGRVPRALDDEGWRQITTAFARGAALLRAHGRLPVIALDDDGLLHGCVSPLVMRHPPTGRVLAVLEACAPCDVLVVVEDLAPGGLDPTAGVAFARVAVAAAQATTLLATAGSAWLAPLHERTKGRSRDDVGHFLASAAWCVGRSDVPVVAVGRSAASDEHLRRRARALGLADVVRC